MESVYFKSRVLRRARYFDASTTLEIELVSGRVYHYFEVPWETYQGLLEAPSQGEYYNKDIKPYYHCQEVEVRA
jgi:hypothetical protein